MYNSRFDCVRFTQDGTGVIFGLVERVKGEIVYQVGVISIDGLQNLDANAISTITIDGDFPQEDIVPSVSELASRVGLALEEDEIDYCFEKLNSAELLH
jgi:hypothetical protein